MRSRKFIWNFIFVLISLSVGTVMSCTHKELCYDHSHTCDIDVIFDWSKAPDASPETMSLYLFPEDGGKSQRYEFTQSSGGRIRVLPGRYKAICINSDTRNIIIEDRSTYEHFCLSTKDAEQLEGLHTSGAIFPFPTAETEGERTAMSPDSLWVDNLEFLTLDSQNTELVMTPSASFITISIEVKNVNHIRYLYAASGTLSTLAEDLYAGQNALSDDNVTIPVNLHISREEDKLYGTLLALGHCPKTDKKHILTIYAMMNDGTPHQHSYAVTEQIHESEDPHHIVVILDNFTLPEPNPGNGEAGGGFRPEVGEWNTIDIGITM